MNNYPPPGQGQPYPMPQQQHPGYPPASGQSPPPPAASPSHPGYQQQQQPGFGMMGQPQIPSIGAPVSMAPAPMGYGGQPSGYPQGMSQMAPSPPLQPPQVTFLPQSGQIPQQQQPQQQSAGYPQPYPSAPQQQAMPGYPQSSDAMRNPRVEMLIPQQPQSGMGLHPSMQTPVMGQHPPIMQTPGIGETSQVFPQQPARSLSVPVPIIGQPAPLEKLEALVESPTIRPSNDNAFSRCSLTQIPRSNAILSKTKLCFGVTVTPFPYGDHQVPLGSEHIIRCNRCRTYLNPYVETTDQGARWKCNLCFLVNDFPPTYDYDPTLQKQYDRRARAELNCPVYDFLAPTEYMMRPPQPPVYLFLIDVSYGAINSGMVATAARTILEHLESIPNTEGRTKIGFVTYDSSLHFYSFANGDAKMMIVADTSDVFFPCDEGDLVVSLADHRGAIETFLGSLQGLFVNTQISGSALGSALSVAMKLLNNLGGKVIVLQSSLPTLGDGVIKPREDPKALGSPGENSLLKQQTNFYKMLASECSRTCTCIDMFLCPPVSSGGAGVQYLDVASVGAAAKYTGGKVFYYPGFNAAIGEDAMRLASDLATFLSKEVCFEAVVRIRASAGLSVSAYHGSFFMRATDLLNLPNVNPDHSFTAQIILEDNLQGSRVCFQTAVLYTSCHGERRIRVINAAHLITDIPEDVFDGVDCGAMTDLLTKMAVEKVLTGTLDDAKEALSAKMIDIAKAVRAHYKLGANQQQLMLPESIRLLPLLIHGISRTVSLRSGTFTPIDLRSFHLILAKTLAVPKTLALVHPFLFGVHMMPPEAGEPDEATGSIRMPPRLTLTSGNLERHGLYVLDTGLQTIIWCGSAIHPELCSLIFGQPYGELESGRMRLPALDNPWSQRLNLILAKRRQLSQTVYQPTCLLVKEDADSSLKMAFLALLLEDRSIDGSQPSYSQWLGTVREKSSGA